MNYQVTHTTVYTYNAPVSLCHNLVHLAPRDCPNQICRSNQILIEPTPSVSSKRLDYFGNHMTYFTVHEPHDMLTVRAVSEIDRTVGSLASPADTPPWDAARDMLSSDRTAPVLDAYQFIFDSTYVKCSAEFAGYAISSFAPGRPLIEAVLELTGRIHSEFKYDASATTIGTPIRDVLRDRRGVCQDFAHLEIACLRSLGLAAKYVSGYLCTNHSAQNDWRGADASHAWVSVFCPGVGWVDFDPTNNVVPSDKHIVVGWGRDYDDVSPIKGVVLGGGHHSVSVAVDVVPLA